jgi:hypothetical protein
MRHRGLLEHVLLPVVAAALKLRTKFGSAAKRAASWIKTPAVVVSQNSADLRNAVGGHNLNVGNTIRIRADKSIPRGGSKLIEEDGAKVLLLNDDDAAGASGIAREVGKGRPIPAVIPAPRPPRPPAEALELAKASPELRSSAARIGWEAGRSTLTVTQAASTARLAELEGNSMHISRLDRGGFTVVRPHGEPHTIDAWTYPDLIDVIQASAKGAKKGTPLRLHVEGMPAEDVERLVRDCEFHVEREVDGVVRDLKVSADELVKTLRDNYEFSRAVITEETVPQASAGREMRFKLEIPHIEAEKPSLLLRVKIFLASRVSPQLAAALRASIRKVTQTRLAAATADGLDLQLKREIRAVFRKHKVQGTVTFELTTQQGDVYLAERPISGERDAQSDHAA